MKIFKYKKMPLLTLFLLLSWVAMAQIFTVRGTVTDAAGEALVGASVVEKGTANGVITDFDGKYELKTKANATLTFSFVGYVSQEINVGIGQPIKTKENATYEVNGGNTAINVILQDEAAALKELVVVGYGAQRKSDLTGSVSKLKGTEIQSIATPSVAQALQGKVAGVLVTPSSGSPGAGAVIRIRGTGTLNNSNPFFVVDGMLLDDADFLNPNDIESIEVLKDASATAIYGSRGANGVIIISTKKGTTKGKAQISAASYYGQQDLVKRISLTNAVEYATLRNEIAGSKLYPNPETLGEGTDWQSEVFRDAAPIQNFNVAVRGGNDLMTYAISGDYIKQDGILKGGDFQRVSLRINNEYRPTPFLKIGHNIALVDDRSNFSPGLIYNAYYAPPTIAPIDSAGKFGNTTTDANVGNPTAQLHYERYNNGGGFRTVGNLFIDIQLFKGLNFRSNVGLDWGISEGKRFVPVFFVTPTQKNEVNNISASRNKSRNRLWENTLTFDRTFKKHKINALAGMTAQLYDGYGLGGSSTKLPKDVDNITADIVDLLFLSAGTEGFNVYETSDAWRMQSYLFRLNYTFNDRYLLTASMRRDGSSKFGKNNRWGNFPSVAAGWRMKEEAFFKNLDWLSNLKFRASWGIIGNEKIDQNAKAPPVTDRLDAVFGINEKFATGATITRLPNPDLRWEETQQTDIGFEMGFLNNRLTAEIDWYSRTTYDILTDLPIPAFIGAASPPTVNAASVLNKGWDLNFGWRDRVGKLGYSLNLIGSTVHNEVIDLGEGKEEIFSGGVGEGGKLGTRTVVGSPIGAYYGYKVVGVYQNAEDLAKYPKRVGETAGRDVVAGDLIYADLDGDGVITTKDRTYLGNPIPKFIFSANLGFDFMGFDFMAQLNGVRGNKVMNAKRLARFAAGNFEKTFLQRWNGAGTSNFEPRATIGGRNYEVSERFLEDGAFTSLRNVTLGYNLPLSIARKMKLQSLRVYASGTNIKLWTKYTGYTPEIVNGSTDVFSVGIDRGVYPVGRTYTLGFNVAF